MPTSHSCFCSRRCTQNELIRQIEWLKAENERLRKHVDRKQNFLDQNEKSRLIELDQAIGSDLKHIITIVSYNTYLIWFRKELEDFRPKKMGRPRTAESIRNLIREDRHRDRLGLHPRDG